MKPTNENKIITGKVTENATQKTTENITENVTESLMNEEEIRWSDRLRNANRTIKMGACLIKYITFRFQVPRTSGFSRFSRQ